MSDSNFSAIRARLRYESIEEFIDGYARFISAGGMFIPMAPNKLKPIGTTIRFQFLLTDASTALLGEGVVVQVRPPDASNSRAPVGMLVKFSKLSQESKNLVDQIVAMKETGAFASSSDAFDEDEVAEPQSEGQDEPAEEPAEDPYERTHEMKLQDFLALDAERERAEQVHETPTTEAPEDPATREAPSAESDVGPRKLGQTAGGLQILAFDDISDEEAREMDFDLGAEESDIDEMFAGLFGGGDDDGGGDMFGGAFGSGEGAPEGESSLEFELPEEEAFAEAQPEEQEAEPEEEAGLFLPQSEPAEDLFVEPVDHIEDEVLEEAPVAEEPVVEEEEEEAPLEEEEEEAPLEEEEEEAPLEEEEEEAPLEEEEEEAPLEEEEEAPLEEEEEAPLEEEEEAPLEEEEPPLSAEEELAAAEALLAQESEQDDEGGYEFDIVASPRDFEAAPVTQDVDEEAIEEAVLDEQPAELPDDSEGMSLELESDALELIEGSEVEELLEEEEEGEPPSPPSLQVDHDGPSELENLLGNLESAPEHDDPSTLTLASSPEIVIEDAPAAQQPEDDDEESLEFLLGLARHDIQGKQEEKSSDDRDILDDLLGDDAGLPPAPSDSPMFNPSQPPTASKEKKGGFLSKLFGKD